MVATATVGALSSAAGSISAQLVVVAGVGIGVGLLIYGISKLVRVFKRTAR